MKIKQVLPSLKEKKRYIAFKVISQARTSLQSEAKAITSSMLSFSGELGTAAAAPLFPKQGIIKVSNKSSEQARAAIALVQEIDGKPALVQSLGTSGMLNKAEKYLNQ